MVQVIHDNVGALDAALRAVLGIAALAGAASTYRLLSHEWGLVTWIHGAILATYLLLTAATRLEPVYFMLDASTVGGWRRERIALRAVPRRPVL
ncbi:MAG TPA: YgaP-like transmembrane domain [Candidatus Thermoplasmatota archaeon]|nr:YgaP-like transmembrane domain [Candidatus Thermoplasmatota archaeon]